MFNSLNITVAGMPLRLKVGDLVVENPPPDVPNGIALKSLEDLAGGAIACATYAYSDSADYYYKAEDWGNIGATAVGQQYQLQLNNDGGPYYYPDSSIRIIRGFSTSDSLGINYKDKVGRVGVSIEATIDMPPIAVYCATSGNYFYGSSGEDHRAIEIYRAVTPTPILGKPVSLFQTEFSHVSILTADFGYIGFWTYDPDTPLSEQGPFGDGIVQDHIWTFKFPNPLGVLIGTRRTTDIHSGRMHQVSTDKRFNTIDLSPFPSSTSTGGIGITPDVPTPPSTGGAGTGTPGGSGGVVIPPTTGSGGGGTGAISGSGSRPLAMGWNSDPVLDERFPGTSLNTSIWIPNRWDGTLPTNESTNIPNLQLDTSYSSNLVVNDGLSMNVSNQPDPSLAGSWPYAGAHLTSRAAWLTPNSLIQVVCRVTDRGSDWPAICFYGQGSPGGEIDLAEFGNTRQNKCPTWNIHPGDYHAQTGPQGFYGNPQIASDGRYHVYEIYRNSGTQVTPYLDGVQCGDTLNMYDAVDMIIALELGVSNSSPSSSGLGPVMEVSRIAVWHGAPAPVSAGNGFSTNAEPGYTVVYANDYTTNMSMGGWDSSPYAATDAVYDGFHSTDGIGMYSKDIISANNSILDFYLHTSGGVPYSAATIPIGFGGFGPYSIVEIRCRADESLAGFKSAFLLWPNTDTWGDGENDIVECYFGPGAQPTWFLHGLGSNAPSNIEAVGLGINMNDWHTYRCVTTPSGISIYVDGVLRGQHNSGWSTIGHHLITQTETWFSAPDPGVSGHVQIDWIKIQVPS